MPALGPPEFRYLVLTVLSKALPTCSQEGEELKPSRSTAVISVGRGKAVGVDGGVVGGGVVLVSSLAMVPTTAPVVPTV